MWKRDQTTRPDQTGGTTGPSPYEAQAVEPLPRTLGKEAATIGKSVRVNGQLSGSENLKIEGYVEGKIELGDHALIVGPNGAIKAEVVAKVVVVEGQVDGNISASERVDIRDSGSMEGDITAPRVVIADGAVFRGTVDMKRGDDPARQAASAKPPAKDLKGPPAPAPPVAPAPSAVKAGAP